MTLKSSPLCTDRDDKRLSPQMTSARSVSRQVGIPAAHSPAFFGTAARGPTPAACDAADAQNAKHKIDAQEFWRRLDL